MRAGEGDAAKARTDRSKPKAAQFQSFILIHSFLPVAVQCSKDQSLMNLLLGRELLLDEYPSQYSDHVCSSRNVIFFVFSKAFIFQGSVLSW